MEQIKIRREVYYYDGKKILNLIMYCIHYLIGQIQGFCTQKRKQSYLKCTPAALK